VEEDKVKNLIKRSVVNANSTAIYMTKLILLPGQQAWSCGNIPPTPKWILSKQLHNER